MIMRDSSIQCDQLNKKSDNNGIKGDGKRPPRLMPSVVLIWTLRNLSTKAMIKRCWWWTYQKNI